MKSIIIGQRIIPIWLIAALSISGIGAVVLANYVLNTFIIPLEVKEPIEILHYPSTLSLYPGETEQFNVTVQNHSSEGYLVTFNFQLSNKTYQDNYVTFSNENYTIIPGQQNLTAWLEVEPHAPTIDTSLTIQFERLPGSPTYPYQTEQLQVIQVIFWGTQTHINITIQNTGTLPAVVTEILVNNSTAWTGETTIQPNDQKTIAINVAWASGIKYQIKILTSTGKQLIYIAVAP